MTPAERMAEGSKACNEVPDAVVAELVGPVDLVEVEELDALADFAELHAASRTAPVAQKAIAWKYRRFRDELIIGPAELVTPPVEVL